MKTSRIVALLLSFAILVSMTACSKDVQDGPFPTVSQGGNMPENEGQPAKDTFVYGLGRDFTTFDPHNSSDATTKSLLRFMYECLVDMKDGEIVPALASEWDVDSDGNYTFTLRNDVFFHNGDKMTAEDVVFSIERAKTSHGLSSFTTNIQNAEVVDPSHVKVNMIVPNGLLLKNLANCSILNKKVVEEQGDNYGVGSNEFTPVGTGPYKFISYAASNQTEAEAFDLYWGEQALQIKHVLFKFIPDNTTRALALEANQIDFADALDVVDMPALMNNPDIYAETIKGGMVYYLSINVTQAPFDDINLRKAVCSAVNLDAINQASFGGNALPAALLASPNSFGYMPDLAFPTNNIEEAKRYLAESRYSNGTTIHLMCASGIFESIAAVIQDNLRQANIDVVVDVVEWGALFDRGAAGDYEFFIDGWIDEIGDCSNVFAPVVGTNGWNNYSGYSNVTLDRLLAEADGGTDQDTRAAQYRTAWEMVIDDCPIVPLIFKGVPYAHNANLKNVAYNEFSWLNWGEFYFG